MENWILKMNVQLHEKQLAQETDSKKRKVLEGLLEKEYSELAALNAGRSLNTS